MATPRDQLLADEHEHWNSNWPYKARYITHEVIMHGDTERPLLPANKEVSVGLVLELDHLFQAEGNLWQIFASWLKRLYGQA